MGLEINLGYSRCANVSHGSPYFELGCIHISLSEVNMHMHIWRKIRAPGIKDETRKNM